MGIIPDTLALLQRHIDKVGGIVGRKMLELGNQQMMCHADVQEGSAAKEYFNKLGVEHVSVDMNGLLGALPLDLSKPIDKPEWVNYFDIVTDYGTSEHVTPGDGMTPAEALWNCRRSCHRFCRPGGLMIFANPHTGHWPGHGVHYFTQGFYKCIAEFADYNLLEMSTPFCCGNFTDSMQVMVVLIKKQDNEFLSLEQFQNIYAENICNA